MRPACAPDRLARGFRKIARVHKTDDAAAAQAATTEEAPKAKVAGSPWWAAALFWLGIIAMVLADALLPAAIVDSGGYAIGVKVTVNMLVGLWVLADGRSRGMSEHELGLAAGMTMLLTEIMLPVYLVRTRGWRGAGRAVLRFALQFLAIAVVLLLLDQLIPVALL